MTAILEDNANLLLRIAPYDRDAGAYPVEATLNHARRYQGGQLRLDWQSLLVQELQPDTYGLTLFDALFAGPIKEAYDQALSSAETLRVHLWIEDGAADLHAVPWERLYHRYKGHALPLAATAATPFSRYTGLTTAEPEPITETPLQLLVVVSNPANLPDGITPANVDAEVDNLRIALVPLLSKGLLSISVLPGRTGLSADLQKQLKRAGWQILSGAASLDNLMRHLPKCHLFHFIGHGAFRRKDEHGPGHAALYLEEEDGKWVAVRDDAFVNRLLALAARPRLMFFAACGSATRDTEHAFVGLGPKLVQADVPAVVAMQDQAPMDMVRDLTAEFYRALTAQGEVDTALNQARLRVFDARRTDWAIPVLFTRLRDGRLFALGEAETKAPGESPYKGLNGFDEQDADNFFGRDALTAELAERVRTGRFLAVVGASGSGKSSVVRAGVIPTLRRDERTRWRLDDVITPTAQPLEALAASLTRHSESVTATTTLMDDMHHEPRALHLYARRLLGGGNARLLLVVDQFEELFTACKDPALRQAFIDNLMAATNNDDGPVTVLLTLRADFYAHCAQYDGLRDAFEKHQKFIDRLKEAELRQAIEGPARRGGWELEPGLVERILEDAGDEPGALPLISHALLSTWKQRRGRRLTLAGYQSTGGVKEALTRTADETLGALTPEQRAIARRIFTRLTELGEGTQDTRRRAALDELSPLPEDRPEVERVLAQLATNRLITTDRDVAEVAHEALIREWPQLRSWLDEDRAGLRLHRQLTDDAGEWAALNQSEDALYRGVRLAQAREWAEAHPADLNALERDFLAASRALAERERVERETQRRRELESAQQLVEIEKQRAEEQTKAAGQLRKRNQFITVAGMVAFIAALLALGFGLSASDSARIARIAEARAFSRQLVAQGQLEYEDNPLLGLRLALEGLANVPAGEDDVRTSIAKSVYDLMVLGRRQKIGDGIQEIYSSSDLDTHYFVVRYADDTPSELRHTADGTVVPLTGDVSSVVFSSHLNAKYWVVRYVGGAPSELRHTADGTVIPLAGDAVSVVFSPDPDLKYFVVKYAGDTPAELRHTADDTVVPLAGDVDYVIFSPDTKYFVVRYADGTPGELRHTADGTVVPLAGDVLDVIFSPDPDLKYFLVRYADGAPSELHHTADDTVIPLAGDVDYVIFSPDPEAKYLAVTYADDTPGQLRRTADGTVVPLTGDVFYVIFSPDPDTKYFMVRYADGTPAELRHATDGIVERFVGDVSGVVFSRDPDLKYFVVTYADGTPGELRHTADGTVIPLTGDVYYIIFSPDPDLKYFLVRYADGTPSELRHNADGTVIPLAGDAVSVVFSPDPDLKYFVVKYAGDTPTELRHAADDTVVPLAGDVFDVIFSPDPDLKYFVVTYADGAPGELRHTDDGTVVPLAGDVSRVVFSSDPDLKYFVVKYAGDRSELWTTQNTERRLADLELGLTSFVFDVQSQRLILHYSDGRAYMLDLELLTALTTTLTPDELLRLGCTLFTPEAFDEGLLAPYLEGKPLQACQ